MPTVNPHSSGSTQYNVVVQDLSGTANPVLVASMVTLIKEAGARLSQWIPGAGTVDVRLVLDPAVGVASGGAMVSPVATGSYNGVPVHPSVFMLELATGQDFNGAADDLVMTVNPSFGFFYDPTPATGDDLPAGQADFLTTVLHEMVHGLAFTGYRGAGGTLTAPLQSPFDQHLTYVNGQPYFAGPFATAVYGGLVPLTPGNHFHYGTAPSSASHGHLGGIMNGGGLTMGLRYDLGDLDLAMLQDTGLAISKAGDAFAQVWGGVGSDSITASAASIMYGLAGNDFIQGSNGDDIIYPGIGNDTVNGGGGHDTVIFSGLRANYVVTRTATGFLANGSSTGAVDGVDALQSVEKLRFSDISIDLSMKEKAATIPAGQLKTLMELYVAFFNRMPDAEGLGFWIDRVHAGQPLAEIADAFYGAALLYPELTGYSSGMPSENFVRLVYRNVLGRADGGDAEGVAFWSQALDTGAQSRGALVSSILATAHTFKGSPTYGYVADLLDNKAFVAEYVAIDQGITHNTPQDAIRNGMAIAAAVTPQSTDAAIAMVGVQPAVFAVSSPSTGSISTVANVERIQFADVGVALDLDANAGKAAKIIGAVFGREALANKTYVGIGLQLLDAGMSYTDLSQLALNARFGTVFTNETQVAALYRNVTGVDAPAAELAYYAGLVSSDQFSQAQLGVLAADSPANQLSIDLVGLAATGIDFYPHA